MVRSARMLEIFFFCHDVAVLCCILFDLPQQTHDFNWTPRWISFDSNRSRFKHTAHFDGLGHWLLLQLDTCMHICIFMWVKRFAKCFDIKWMRPAQAAQALKYSGWDVCLKAYTHAHNDRGSQCNHNEIESICACYTDCRCFIAACAMKTIVKPVKMRL